MYAVDMYMDVGGKINEETLFGSDSHIMQPAIRRVFHQIYQFIFYYYYHQHHYARIL